MNKMIFITLLSACNLQNVNRTTLVTSTASLACDWGQTRSAAKDGWKGRMEANPIMGPNPTTKEVNFYFASTIAINTAIWFLMPKKFKSVIPTGVTLVQSNTIHNNMDTTSGICGL